MRLEQTRLVLGYANDAVEQRKQQDDFADHLTRYILIVFCAEVEQGIKDIIRDILQESSNSSISDFLEASIDSIIRGTDKREIYTTLKYFGNDKLPLFRSRVDDQVLRNFKNFVINRNTVAHRRAGITISWAEVQHIADVGEEILVAFRDAFR